MKKSVPASTTTPLQKRPPLFFSWEHDGYEPFLYVHTTPLYDMGERGGGGGGGWQSLSRLTKHVSAVSSSANGILVSPLSKASTFPHENMAKNSYTSRMTGGKKIAVGKQEEGTDRTDRRESFCFVRLSTFVHCIIVVADD